MHAVHGSAPRGPQHPLTYSWEEVEAEGARLLHHARERLEVVADGPVHVTTEVVRGRVVHRLLAVSADASSLVLSGRGLPRHTPRSGVSAALAGRAICPVVSVPRSWRPEDGFVRRVVLALGDLEHPGRLVGHAFELAATPSRHRCWSSTSRNGVPSTSCRSRGPRPRSATASRRSR